MATFHTGLSRKGPGLMIRDLQSGRDDQANAVLSLLAHVDADLLVLLDVDWDHAGVGLAALASALDARGVAYPHGLAPAPNSGKPSGLDLDGNGYLGEARDALGYGRFRGDGGLAILSRYPLTLVQDHSGLLWRDRPGGAAESVLSAQALDHVPLATTAQWVVRVDVETDTLHLIPMAAGPPVFDGPEDRNGLRNKDELGLVAELAQTVARPLVMGRANLDPADGEGHRDAVITLMSHANLQDPEPKGAVGGGAGHAGDPRLDTANWPGPGPLRVDYILPARSIRVLDAGVLWPRDDDPLSETVTMAGAGRVVWADLSLP